MAKLKLTPELIEKAVTLLSAGNYIETTCDYLGISKETFYRWLRHGENAKSGIYHDFYDAIKKAGAIAESRNVALIQTAAKDTWQAAAWYLERKHPERWGRDRLKKIDEDASELEKLAKAVTEGASDELDI